MSQQVVRELHSIQFGLKVQDAILSGYRITRTFGKPDMQYKAILSKVGGLQAEQKIDYKQNLDLKDTNQLHFALKLQQAILGGYRLKSDKRFGKFGVCWYASLEIGKGQLEELLVEQQAEQVVVDEPKVETETVVIEQPLDATEVETQDVKQTVDKTTAEDVKPAPKKRTPKAK